MTELLNDNADIREEDVIRFLQHHPAFFEQHPHILKRLHLHHDSGEAISLIERQNHILRKENRDLIDRLNQFINVAQRNDRLFLNLQHLVIHCISCNSLNELAEALTDGLIERFDVDAVQIVLSHQVAHEDDLWLHCDKMTLTDLFPAAIKEQKSMCGTFDKDTNRMLFGHQKIGSVALGAIACKSGQVGLLALGNRNESHFRSGTDTLFLSHLSRIVSLMLDRFSAGR